MATPTEVEMLSILTTLYNRLSSAKTALNDAMEAISSVVDGLPPTEKSDLAQKSDDDCKIDRLHDAVQGLVDLERERAEKAEREANPYSAFNDTIVKPRACWARKSDGTGGIR